MDVLVFLSEKAFLSIVISAIETYKDECYGVLVGTRKGDNIFFVDYATPYQYAEISRKSAYLPENRRRRIRKILTELTPMDMIGEYHSHPDGELKLSENDKESMMDGAIEILVTLWKKKKNQKWAVSTEGGYLNWKYLYGTIGDYYLQIAAFYKPKNGTPKQVKITCPYAVGFDSSLMNLD